jgi:hypothetical protein
MGYLPFLFFLLYIHNPDSKMRARAEYLQEK